MTPDIEALTIDFGADHPLVKDAHELGDRPWRLLELAIPTKRDFDELQQVLEKKNLLLCGTAHYWDQEFKSGLFKVAPATEMLALKEWEKYERNFWVKFENLP